MAEKDYANIADEINAELDEEAEKREAMPVDEAKQMLGLINVFRKALNEGKKPRFGGKGRIVDDKLCYEVLANMEQVMPAAVATASRVYQQQDALFKKAQNESKRLVIEYAMRANAILEGAQNNADNIVEDAKAKAEKIIRDAEERADKMLEESTIIAKAEQQAEEIRRNAQRETEEYIQDRIQVTLHTLSMVGDNLGKALTVIDNSRKELSDAAQGTEEGDLESFETF